MIGPAPTMGGALYASGSGGGYCDPSTDTPDPAAPATQCNGGDGPGPGSGGSGDCGGGDPGGGYPGGGGGGGTCSANGGGGNPWGGGGTGDHIPQSEIQSAGSSGSSCGCSGGGGWGGNLPFGGATWNSMGSGNSGGGSGGGGAYLVPGNGRNRPYRSYSGPGTRPSGGNNHIFFGQADSSPCQPPPGGPAPVPVLGPGGSQSVNCTVTGMGQAGGLPVTCTETGVTLVTPFNGALGCKAVFYFDNSYFLVTVHFSTPGGVGAYCQNVNLRGTYGAGSTTAKVGFDHDANISVSYTPL